MGSRKSRILSARVDSVRRRFEHWRRTRKVLSRVPEPLWAAAVEMAGTCGISHTAKALPVQRPSVSCSSLRNSPIRRLR